MKGVLEVRYSLEVILVEVYSNLNLEEPVELKHSEVTGIDELFNLPFNLELNLAGIRLLAIRPWVIFVLLIFTCFNAS